MARVYEFLTNEEKDVEAEIKALDVDPSEVSKELETLAFDTVLRHRKIKHHATGSDYPFTRKLDDHALGREYELSINLISPFSDDVDHAEAVRMKSMSHEELVVLMKPTRPSCGTSFSTSRPTNSSGRRAAAHPSPGAIGSWPRKANRTRAGRKTWKCACANSWARADVRARG